MIYTGRSTSSTPHITHFQSFCIALNLTPDMYCIISNCNETLNAAQISKILAAHFQQICPRRKFGFSTQTEQESRRQWHSLRMVGQESPWTTTKLHKLHKLQKLQKLQARKTFEMLGVFISNCNTKDFNNDDDDDGCCNYYYLLEAQIPIIRWQNFCTVRIYWGTNKSYSGLLNVCLSWIQP